MEKVISIFGSGNINLNEKLYSQAEQAGKLLAENKYVVCSGGYGGVMEAISKGAKSAGGKTYGVTVSEWDSPNKYITEEIKMPNLMERLTELIAIGDAYVFFKGGTGTLAEISIALELMNKGLMKEKNIIFFDTFWKNVIECIRFDSKRINDIIEKNVKFIQEPAEIIEILLRF